jgi:hypothetical protein
MVSAGAPRRGYGWGMCRTLLLVPLAGCGALAGGAEENGASQAIADAAWHYDVTVSEDLSRADVRLELRETPPPALILGLSEGLPYLGDAVARWSGSRMLLGADGDALLLDDVGPDASIRYSVSLGRLADDRRGGRVGRDVVLTPGLVLLRPRPLPDAPHASLTLHLPKGAASSAPWARTSTGTYSLDESSFRWRGFFAIGPMETHEVRIGQATLNAAILDHPHAATWGGLERWLTRAADAVADLYGGFPVERCQVVVKPVPSDEAVPFGETLRGGGRATVLYVGDHATDRDFEDDWVAVHELTHLGMPAIPEGDAWLSEGFVQYYTETLRGRAGLLDERAAWQCVVDGFERGRRSGTGRTLAEESDAMHRTHSWFRVYWGGAAIAMFLDVELRQASRGGLSLDDAMREVRRTFSPRPKEASAAEIVKHLDEWLGRPLFSEISSRHLAEKRFPPVEETLRRLGVVVRDGVVSLDDAAPDATIRRAIMTRARR